MALSYGTEGIKQKNWILWLYKPSIVTLEDGGTNLYDAFIASGNTAYWEVLCTAAEYDSMVIGHLGELRNDSVSLISENGDTLEGNIVGEVVLNKVCSLNAELINATIENCNELAAYDGLPVFVIMHDSAYVSSDFRAGKDATVIIIENCTLNYNESVVGGDIERATVSFSKSPSRVDDFRKIITLS